MNPQHENRQARRAGRPASLLPLDYYSAWRKRHFSDSLNQHIKMLEAAYSKATGTPEEEMVTLGTFRDYLASGRASPELIQKLLVIANHRSEFPWVELRQHLKRSLAEYRDAATPMQLAPTGGDEEDLVPYSPEEMAEIKNRGLWGDSSIDPRRFSGGRLLMIGYNGPTAPARKLVHLVEGDVPDPIYTGARVVCRALHKLMIEDVTLDEGQLFSIGVTHWTELHLQNPTLGVSAEKIETPSKAQALEAHQCFITAHQERTCLDEPFTLPAPTRLVVGGQPAPNYSTIDSK